MRNQFDAELAELALATSRLRRSAPTPYSSMRGNSGRGWRPWGAERRELSDGQGLTAVIQRSRGTQTVGAFFPKAPCSAQSLVFALAVNLLVTSACAFGSRHEASMPYQTSLENDLRAIEELNRRDVEAVLASDTDTLMAHWSDDFVVLPPAGPIVRGRRANAEMVQKLTEQTRAMEPVEFIVDFQEITVAGDYAFQWGTYRGATRLRAGGEAMAYAGKLMRILQRQRDGSWKIHRSIATSDPPAREQSLK
jgi:uncharacterized protein (TIGR02246 family)